MLVFTTLWSHTYILLTWLAWYNTVVCLCTDHRAAADKEWPWRSALNWSGIIITTIFKVVLPKREIQCSMSRSSLLRGSVTPKSLHTNNLKSNLTLSMLSLELNVFVAGRNVDIAMVGVGDSSLLMIIISTYGSKINNVLIFLCTHVCSLSNRT